MVSTNKNSIFYKNNSGLSTALVLILLLFMSVFIFTMVSNYFNLTLDNFKLDQQLDNFKTKFEIIKLDGNLLSINNNFKDNLQITSLTISGNMCTIGSGNNLGLSIIDIGNCTQDLSLETIHPVILETKHGAIIENEILYSLDYIDLFPMFIFGQTYISPTPNKFASYGGNSIYVNVSNSTSNNVSTWTNLDNSLVGYWNFDSGNSTHVFDLTENNNHGIIGSGTTIQGGNKIRGDYVNFGNVNALINITNFNWSASGGPVTISYWNYMASSNVGASILFSMGDSGVNGQDRFQVHSPWVDNFIIWDYGNLSLGGRISTDYTSYLDKWTHVTLVSGGNGGNFKAIYLDGELKNSEASSDGPDKILIGGLIGKGVYFNAHRGDIDELLVFDRVLSENEIKSLYNSKLNQYNNNFTNLTAGTHTFQTCTTDITGNYQCLDQRNIILS